MRLPKTLAPRPAGISRAAGIRPVAWSRSSRRAAPCRIPTALVRSPAAGRAAQYPACTTDARDSGIHPNAAPRDDAGMPPCGGGQGIPRQAAQRSPACREPSAWTRQAGGCVRSTPNCSNRPAGHSVGIRRLVLPYLHRPESRSLQVRPNLLLPRTVDNQFGSPKTPLLSVWCSIQGTRARNTRPRRLPAFRSCWTCRGPRQGPAAHPVPGAGSLESPAGGDPLLASPDRMPDAMRLRTYAGTAAAMPPHPGPCSIGLLPVRLMRRAAPPGSAGPPPAVRPPPPRSPPRPARRRSRTACMPARRTPVCGSRPGTPSGGRTRAA